MYYMQYYFPKRLSRICIVPVRVPVVSNSQDYSGGCKAVGERNTLQLDRRLLTGTWVFNTATRDCRSPKREKSSEWIHSALTAESHSTPFATANWSPLPLSRGRRYPYAFPNGPTPLRHPLQKRERGAPYVSPAPIDQSNRPLRPLRRPPYSSRSHNSLEYPQRRV